MTTYGQSQWATRIDVIRAFRAVDQEIRLRNRRLASLGFALSEACDLARRIKDQRDLVHQLMDRRNRRHGRRLLKLNRRHRERLLAIVREAGLDTSVLVFT